MDNKLLQKLCDRIGGLANGAGVLNTGFNDFDGVINGLKGGEVIVDYFQMLCSSNKFSLRDEELSYISRSFKKLALEFDVPIIIVSQLNRSVGNQGMKKVRD